MTTVRKGQAPGQLERAEFGRRFRNSFVDPAFRAEEEAIGRLEAIAWTAYAEARKAPLKRKAGPGYADTEYELSVDWLAARDRIENARKIWADPTTKSRALVICGSPRNDGTCPGEISKTFRLARIVQDELSKAKIEVDFLDLSLLTSEYGRTIYPCKGCVSRWYGVRSTRYSRALVVLPAVKRHKRRPRPVNVDLTFAVPDKRKTAGLFCAK
jgi:NADPH-dependent FMN reductase